MARQATCLAARHGCPATVGVCIAEVATSMAFRPACADLVVAVRFLHRPTLPLLFGLVCTGGYLVYSHFLDGCQHTAVGTPTFTQGFFLAGGLAPLAAWMWWWLKPAWSMTGDQS